MTSRTSGGAATPLFYAYRAITALIAPLAYRKVAAKLAAQGVAEARQRERLGHASLPRPVLPPDAPLIWFHGASVGESQAAMTLINRLSERLPQARFLLTSGTATSAALAAKRLPGNAMHQFAPLDAAAPVRRFLAHWRPDAGIFVESELWPVTLAAAQKTGTRLALVNARISARSVKGWQKRAATARFILSRFDLLLSQNDQMAQTLIALGADPARVLPGGNLKAGAPPLPVDETALTALRGALRDRPVWIASSTHEGEEETILSAHNALLKQHPDLCLVLIPRHPERADEILGLIDAAGLTSARRSTGEALTPQAQVYLADTLGELGTFYALSPIVFLGGSLRPIGGHNPFEVASAGAAVITGPGTSNFSETFPPLITAGGAVEVSDANDLAQTVTHWLEDKSALEQTRVAARQFAADQARQLDGVTDMLIDRLGLTAADASRDA
ncbi:3-deoxy-D-manno-octulosonic acid transferase [Phaeobacter sp. PT47_59]|uniref:3-deoxy-D-manno-octulosonic acid transferase n=1 Tax=Phaeobacter sp. PT47_59 TaxID=3029979 RepID=UPI0023806F7D|nr:3-deoxy-D-manno-octulosonic acid transferase [Phaeobacter sp. PT47_59]MDE4173988.1 3-deoxy-D-manno-octulosonic acid transferase [Phaeobacter sp. PT47_59]